MAVSASGGELKTPVGDAPVIPLILIGAGMYLAWFGVHYWRRDVKWPTDPIKSVLQGKGVPGTGQAPQAQQAVLAADISQAVSSTTSGADQGSSSGAGGGSGGSGGGTLDSQGKTNKQILQMYATAHGWTGSQWDCLDWVEMAEAGYNSHAQNPSSGAFGLAQALGHGTAGTAGKYGNEYGANYGLSTTEAIAANNGDGNPQAKWMCNYVAADYGTPCAAKAFHQANNYY